MKILVCIKQVNDSADTLQINEATGWIDYSRFTVFRMNRFDEFALEEALLARERIPGTTVHALSVGPMRVSSTIRRALEMGADHGIHLLNPDENYISPFTVASLIASYARGKGYDLILTGVMAEDDMACQVGQLVAAFLDVPCATSVISEEIHPESGEILVEREIEGGCRQSLLLLLPAVLTIQSGINLPRYPSLTHVLRARSQPQEIIHSGDLRISPEREVMEHVRHPEFTSKGMFIEGSPREKAHTILEILHEKSLLLQR